LTFIALFCVNYYFQYTDNYKAPMPLVYRSRRIDDFAFSTERDWPAHFSDASATYGLHHHFIATFPPMTLNSDL